MKNSGVIDRVIRLGLGIIFFQAGFFWLGGIWQVMLYLLGAVLLVTAVTGFCPLYRLFNLSTYNDKARSLGKAGWVAAVLALAVILVGGSYASDFFSRKIYLEDFNAMNNYYKQALFQTGQENRDLAVENYDQLVVTYAGFQDKYSTYHPYVLKGDNQFNADLVRVSQMIAAVDDEVHSGDLHQAHLDLEQVRPVFQDIFKRNGFSMLAVALVDFHDTMELVLDAANEKDAEEVVVLYPQVDDKLKVVEAAANDAEIQLIRTNLDSLLALAQTGQVEQLPDQANTLKSSFVKVYLKRG